MGLGAAMVNSYHIDVFQMAIVVSRMQTGYREKYCRVMNEVNNLKLNLVPILSSLLD